MIHHIFYHRHQATDVVCERRPFVYAGGAHKSDVKKGGSSSRSDRNLGRPDKVGHMKPSACVSHKENNNKTQSTADPDRPSKRRSLVVSSLKVFAPD